MSWIFAAVFGLLTWFSSSNDWPTWITFVCAVLCGISLLISLAKLGILGDSLSEFAYSIDFFPNFGGDDSGGSSD